MRQYINNSSASRSLQFTSKAPKFGVPIKLGNENKVKPTMM